MSFILTPQRGEDVKINAWNWRPTILLLHEAGIINDKQHELWGFQSGTFVNAEMACRIADFIEGTVSTMKRSERIRGDLVVTDKPKEPAIFRPTTKPSDIDSVELYSATYVWLVEFAAFARRSGGFRIG